MAVCGLALAGSTRVLSRKRFSGECFMGQKVCPIGFRTGIMLDWRSTWYAGKQEFADLLVEDFKIRKYVNAFVNKRVKQGRAGISSIRIERTREKVVVYIWSARVGVIIGK